MLVKNLLRLHPRLLTSGEVGVEIEVEGNSLPRDLGAYWRVEEDGSLRGESAEYVLKKPLKISEVGKAIKFLVDSLNENDSEVYSSVRAGVHVHINVQDLNEVELSNFITAYMILEHALVGWCGKHREGNLFCLRVEDAEFLLEKIRAVFLRLDCRLFEDDNIRYSSLNLKALAQYGSLEFRSMRTPTDFSLILDWVEVLHTIKKQSIKYKSPIDLVYASIEDTEGVLKDLLKDFYGTFITDSYKKEFHKYVRYANDFAHLSQSMLIDKIGSFKVKDVDAPNIDKLPLNDRLRIFDDVAGLMPEAPNPREVIAIPEHKMHVRPIYEDGQVIGFERFDDAF